jgi:hypothetical protein
MNSREKGKRGERQWRDELRAQGYLARRGQQFSGSPDSPDVVCEELSWLHFEVKAVETLNIEEAMEQARRDARGECSVSSAQSSDPKVPIVAHRRSFRPWLVTMEAETFFAFLRGDLPSDPSPNGKIVWRSHFSDKANLGPAVPSENNNNQQPKETKEATK